MYTVVAQAAQEAITQGSQTLIVSAISAVTAGLGVKLLDWYINRGNVKADEATQIRDELRQDAKRLGESLNEATRERDEWKERYYQIVSEVETLRLEVEMLKLVVLKNDGSE